MPYEYDAFFSYKRSPLSDGWHELLKTHLEHRVKFQTGNPETKIFFDTEDIQTGQRWEERLGEALKRSKCIICIWSPLYFSSDWCVSEWKTFEARGELLNTDLILPARYQTNIPDYARAIQGRDFSDYTNNASSFKDSPKFLEFEDNCIRPLAQDIVNLINNVPPYRDDFPLITKTAPPRPRINNLRAA